MPIRNIAQLKKWFKRGAYPDEGQFADWLDSFWHKQETIPIHTVDELSFQLNGKYPADDGRQLAKKVDQLAADLLQHVAQTQAALGQLREQLQQLRTEVETNYIKKSDRVLLNGGSPADLTNSD